MHFSAVLMTLLWCLNIPFFPSLEKSVWKAPVMKRIHHRIPVWLYVQLLFWKFFLELNIPVWQKHNFVSFYWCGCVSIHMFERELKFKWWTGMLIIGLETNCKEEWERYFPGNCNDESLYILCKSNNSENRKKILICKNYWTFKKC